jgi:adenylate cyclase
LERKLTAILCADVFGYSRLMGEDEEATHRALTSSRKLIESLIGQHDGRFVNSAGDSVLAEFASVVNAVQCAVEIQTTLKSENANLPPDRRMEFRIGINLGDVIVDGEQIYGDGVNVAARLESLADPGSIFISGSVHEQLGNKLALGYEDLGERSVKNIAKPVRVFQVLLDGMPAARGETRQMPRNYWRGGVLSLAGLAIIVGTIVLVQNLSLKAPHTHASIPPAQSPALSLPGKPSIAVLPFINMSGDHEQEYFSDGITDDLTTALSRLPGLFVIDRNSAFTYKGKPVKAQQVSRELGVRYVLEGSVRKADNQVRITAQLADATTGADLWAVRYDRPLRDVFALQDEIVQKIVTTLNLQLDLLQRGADVRQTTDNLEAYDDFLRGLEYMQSYTKGDNEKARQMFQKAVELDPKYAYAYVWLSYAYWWGWVWQWNHDPHALDRSFQLAQQATALDDSVSNAHVVLAGIYLFKKDYDQAIGEARRAVALNPNSALAYKVLGDVMDCSGKPAEAIGFAETAMRLDPRHHDFYLYLEGWSYTQIGQYEKAVPILKQSISSYPNSQMPHLQLMVDYTELGRDDDAHVEAKEVLRISPHFSLDAQRQLSPQKDQTVANRFYADARKAGLK